MEGDGKLALELLTHMKTTIKRLFIVVIVLLIMLFATNIAWLYCWNLPSEEGKSSYNIESKDNGNAIYNEDGKVDVNGKDNDHKEDAEEGK